MHRHALRFRPFGNPQIETGIVDQQQHIRLFRQNIGLGLSQKAPNLFQISNHFSQAHDGPLLVVTQQSATCRRHKITAPTNHIAGCVSLAPGYQFPHYVTPMQIATGLSGKDKHLAFGTCSCHGIR